MGRGVFVLLLAWIGGRCSPFQPEARPDEVYVACPGEQTRAVAIGEEFRSCRGGGELRCPGRCVLERFHGQALLGRIEVSADRPLRIAAADPPDVYVLVELHAAGP